MGKYRVGIDIGGTFTDLVIFDEQTGELVIDKTFSTPPDFTVGVITSLQKILEKDYRAEDIHFLSHGTTVATNALLERKGANACLFITEGYRAIYEVGDQLREEDGVSVYNIFYEKPPPLIPQSRTIDVPERTDYVGTVLRPINESQLRQRVREIKSAGIDSAAVCLLFSFMNPVHEQRVREIINEEMPGTYVSLSHEVLPEIREYRRLSTVAVDAYVGPILRGYMEKIEDRLKSAGIHTKPYIMHSGGGTVTTDTAKSKAVWFIESGPAAGVIAASFIGTATGYDKVISLDMGGTTAKAALVEEGEPKVTTKFKAGRYPLGIPVIDMMEVGTGGGSIAFIDAQGFLKVGPNSAGADPGPVCYAKGGSEPTVTDANVVLGYFNPTDFLQGKMTLDKELAENAIRERIAQPLGLDVPSAASGILDIVNSSMAEALRQVSINRGYDPRDFALVAFGGSGPAHAGRLAREIGCRCVVVPPWAGVASAVGLLISDVKQDRVLTRIERIDKVAPSQMTEIFQGLEKEAWTAMREEGFSQTDIRLIRRLDLRYAGQGYEITIPVSPDEINERDKDLLRKRFDEYHERICGHKAENAPVQVVNYRVTSVGLIHKPSLKEWPKSTADPRPARKGYRDAYFHEYSKFVSTPIFERSRLLAASKIKGPAIIEQAECSTVIFPDQTAQVDSLGNLVITY